MHRIISEISVKEHAKKFQEIYSEDIEEEFPDEFFQFNEFITKEIRPTEKLKVIKTLNMNRLSPMLRQH